MAKKIIQCQFKNGFSYINLINILGNLELLENYDFVEALKPEIIFFGPYGNDIPKRGDYLRIGVFPECILPPMEDCDFAFGAIDEELVKAENYLKFEFWGNNPKTILKSQPLVVLEKKHFCSFFYSHQINYREIFFRQLNVYKKVNAPGKSMNNFDNVDTPGISRYQSKLNFLAAHKFDISFENYIHPGYCTEKIYGALFAGAVPIYFGDPNIESSFLNKKSFICANNFIKPKHKSTINFLEKACLEDFNNYRPLFNNALNDKIKRKLKFLGREYKMKLITNNFDFTPLINHIKEIDNNDELYLSYLKESWCDKVKLLSMVKKQTDAWKKILDSI